MGYQQLVQRRVHKKILHHNALDAWGDFSFFNYERSDDLQVFADYTSFIRVGLIAIWLENLGHVEVDLANLLEDVLYQG